MSATPSSGHLSLEQHPQRRRLHICAFGFKGCVGLQEGDVDYEALVDAELQAAASTDDRVEQKRRLDKASSYAALNEQRRHVRQ